MAESIHAGIVHDLEADEYHYRCSACGTNLYRLTKGEMQLAIPLHTKSKDCLGAY